VRHFYFINSNKTMPLGASRVAGNSPIPESFRQEVWKVLTKNNWPFDFTRIQTDEALPYV
jgi:hypothetical protein